MKSEIIGGQLDKNGLKDGWWVELNDSITKHSLISHYCGQYKEGKKIGRWDTKIKFNIFDEFEVIGGGKYDMNEMKTGQWVELINNFSNNYQVSYSGFYKKGQKNGYWNTLLKQENDFEIIGGGFYEDGVKDGQWMELNSNDDYRFTQIGEYQRGLKINRWNIIFTKQYTDNYKKIGGGLYNLDGLKYGKWIEIQNEQENFIAYIGEYKNGKKQGKWDILQGLTEINNYNMIGGGCYDENGFKKGSWKEIEQFSYEFDVISIGKYSNGKKIEKWVTMYRDGKDVEYENLGCECFDLNGIKQGQWVEISDNFINQLITYHGYYKDGVKVDMWQIYFREEGKDDFINIGGGFFDNNGIKQGKWVELHENFNDDMKVAYHGDYLYGKKIGKWDTLKLKVDQSINYSHNYSGSSSQNYMTPDDYLTPDDSMDSASFQGINSMRKKPEQNYQQYTQTGQKAEEEHDLHQEEEYDFHQQEKLDIHQEEEHDVQQKEELDAHQEEKLVHYKQEIGVHYEDGQIIYNSKQFQIIGGGQFDKDGIKHGFWIENYLSKSSYFDQIESKGNYNQGKKVGKWIIGCFRNLEIKIGGGNYDENGIKQGQWLDLHNQLNNYSSDYKDYFIDFGEYRDGLKIGRWDILEYSKRISHYQIIGGGSFDQNSIKYGEWVEIYKNGGFSSDMITIKKGEYKNGKKFGKWEIKSSSNQYQKFRPILGGLYDINGQKQGLWLEEQCGSFYELSSKNLILFGEYKNGLKIGQWDYMQIDEDGSNYIIMDGGLFDQNGLKHGLWHLNSKNYFNSNMYNVKYKNGFRIDAWKNNLQLITLL
ncbi:unnamed protein product [Paramecium sonneborni]|uniref:Uncharacterized protein n=1 Tax=Paramecium sonneborni TaxID=65129 RepID=A0A8S1NTS4_9CILI|nr:unnamed protein product [Paramecium sonneborni]